MTNKWFEQNSGIEGHTEVLILDGIFFLTESTLKLNTPLVQETLSDLYENVSHN